MRILVCNYEYPPLGGGGGVITAHLVAELARRHDVTVLTSGALGLPRDEIESSGVRIVRAAVPFRTHATVASVSSMAAFLATGLAAGRRLIAGGAYDVLNTHFVLPTGPVGDVLARAAGIPNVLSLHGGDLFDPTKRLSPHRHRVLRAWIRRLLRRADAVVGQSNNTLENLRRFYGADVRAMRIPLGIPRPPRRAANRERYGCRDADVLMVTVGRLVARKAIHQLLALMEAFRGTDVRLLIVGSGPQDHALRADAGRRGLGGQVLFLGQVNDDDKFGILNMADMYVSTSQHEGFGLVFLEAMACGLPIVCYDHGGQADFLRDEETAFLVPLNDRGRFAERCRTLAERPDVRQAMGTAGGRLASDLYIDRCAARYETIFERVVADRVRKRQPTAGVAV
jgi:glycosyltransferase involved in cell wall biosynthesis